MLETCELDFVHAAVVSFSVLSLTPPPPPLVAACSCMSLDSTLMIAWQSVPSKRHVLKIQIAHGLVVGTRDEVEESVNGNRDEVEKSVVGNRDEVEESRELFAQTPELVYLLQQQC
jgi:hypothetical protein